MALRNDKIPLKLPTDTFLQPGTNFSITGVSNSLISWVLHGITLISLNRIFPMNTSFDVSPDSLLLVDISDVSWFSQLLQWLKYVDFGPFY